MSPTLVGTRTSRPRSRKYRKEWEAEQQTRASWALESPAEQLTKLAALRESGVLSDTEFETLKVRLLAAT